jgi:predicted dehydrogenase
MGESEVFGVGVIGLGEIGQCHLHGFDASPGSRIVAVSDLDGDLSRAAAEQFGATSYTSYQELIDDPSVEIVSVCLPHVLHYDVLMSGIAAGKHMLCEKPFCMNVEEADEVIEAADRAGVTIGLQHNQLFYGPHVRARQLIEEGAIGRPVLGRFRLAIGGKFPGWRSDPKVTGGGILYDAGVHRFYTARYLLGEVASVSAMSDVSSTEGENVALVALRFESGALGIIEANYFAPEGTFDDSIEISGTEGSVYVSGCEAEFVGFRTGPPLMRYDGSWHYERAEQGDWLDSIVASIDAFVRALREGSEPPVTAREGRRVIELIHQVYGVMQTASA